MHLGDLMMQLIPSKKVSAGILLPQFSRNVTMLSVLTFAFARVRDIIYVAVRNRT
jgi:hypothetical protein